MRSFKEMKLSVRRTPGMTRICLIMTSINWTRSAQATFGQHVEGPGGHHQEGDFRHRLERGGNDVDSPAIWMPTMARRAKPHWVRSVTETIWTMPASVTR